MKNNFGIMINVCTFIVRHHFTDNEPLQFSFKHNAEVKDSFLSPFIGGGVATPRQFITSHSKRDTK